MMIFILQEGQGDTVRCLIDQGADVHAQDNKGRTPLHWAAKVSYNIIKHYILYFTKLSTDIINILSTHFLALKIQVVICQSKL